MLKSARAVSLPGRVATHTMCPPIPSVGVGANPAQPTQSQGPDGPSRVSCLLVVASWPTRSTSLFAIVDFATGSSGIFVRSALPSVTMSIEKPIQHGQNKRLLLLSTTLTQRRWERVKLTTVSSRHAAQRQSARCSYLEARRVRYQDRASSFRGSH
jgi:hypothetical protein